MGKVKKFGASSTLIFRRNSHQKKVRAQCAPHTLRVNKYLIVIVLKKKLTSEDFLCFDVGEWSSLHFLKELDRTENQKHCLYVLLVAQS